MQSLTTDPLFTAVDADEFTEQHLAGLAAGTLAAVRIPGFLDATDCALAMSGLDRLPTADYDPVRVPTPIMRFGPALNDYRTDECIVSRLAGGPYWEAAQAARQAWRAADMDVDPIAISLERLSTAWGSPVTPATIVGQPVFGGTLREINNGALIHYDDINREIPGVFDQKVIAQLAFNVWVAAPDGGGATNVWRHRWEPTDEQHRTSYGYLPEAVAAHQKISLTPELGDALLFNPNNFHSVEPNKSGRRIAFAFFLGLTSNGQLIVWS